VSCTGTGYEYFCEGRRPLGHVEGGDEECSDALGRTLAAMAHLEAASVVAFEQLAAQLRGFDAPRELIERCGIAASEERAHARWLTMLAVRRGAVVPEVTQTSATSSLLDVALHNAVEGCVHETFAALLAAHRERRASSPTLRRVFAKLAIDEAGHAQLAWDIHAWLQTQLAPAQAQAVVEAQQQALARLPERARELASLPAELGSLTIAEAEALARALHEQLAA
jgi:rubrerythrin